MTSVWRRSPVRDGADTAMVEGNEWRWGQSGRGCWLAPPWVWLPLSGRVAGEDERSSSASSPSEFVGAVVVALIVSFAMLGVFFFLALYMQNILRYSPLEAGVRFLPSTLMIVGVAPVAGRMADRFGPRWLIVAGLAIVAASLYSFTGVAVDSTYLDLLPGFMLLGIGIALTMSPMTSAAMNAVAVEKAGVASGVLSMFRMVGGSLGVAVTGAIFQGAVGGSFESAAAGLCRRAQCCDGGLCRCSATLRGIAAAAIRASRNLSAGRGRGSAGHEPDHQDRVPVGSQPDLAKAMIVSRFDCSIVPGSSARG